MELDTVVCVMSSDATDILASFESSLVDKEGKTVQKIEDSAGFHESYDPPSHNPTCVGHGLVKTSPSVEQVPYGSHDCVMTSKRSMAPPCCPPLQQPKCLVTFDGLKAGLVVSLLCGDRCTFLDVLVVARSKESEISKHSKRLRKETLHR